MEYKKINNQYVVRMDKGEEVLTKLKELCEKEKIKVGSVYGLGAANYVKVGLFDVVEKEYHSKVFEEPLEITSLVGNISTKDGENYLHVHITVANKDMQVFGGHLNECRISATCELYVTSLDTEVEREFSEEIGLNLYKF